MAGNKNSMGWKPIVILILFIGAVTWYYWPPKKVESMQLNDGLHVKFRTHGEQLEIYQDHQWHPFFVKGVNVGTALPGHDPGELPITKETYLRWFSMISDLGANTIRVYTIQNPVFYEAIVEYNQKHPDHPLYFIQGVWSPEEVYREDHDAVTRKARDAFKAEIDNAVGAVYGSITIPKKFGKASGVYKVNAGPYLIAWHIGTEWDPDLVKKTEELHRGEEPYQGAYFHAKPQATAFESMLAEMLNTVAEQETKHGWQHPQTFTNWVTTDPLQHPGEPLIHEDMVSVDATHLEPVQWQAGYFASFHVYPYYPDFFRTDETLQTVRNDKGEIDSYEAYIRQLKAYHAGMPVMITEYGVPSSIGIAHYGSLGRNQGAHNEKEQGTIDADLYHEIVKEKFAGAILFTWQDEWFKKTWNTMFFEMPEDRRKYWLNVLTNEKMFGVLGMYPGKDGVLNMDGDLKDWKSLDPKEVKKINPDIPGWKELWVTHDEGYVYIAAVLEEEFDPAKRTLYLGIDTIQGGNRHAKEMGNHLLDEGLEALITIGNDEESQISIASNYDFHTRLYGRKYGMIPVNEHEMKDDSGVFYPWKLAVNLQMTPPDSKKEYPFEDVVVGHLTRGTTDPSDPNYNSSALWQAKGNIVEMRIPWMLLGFTDPSSLQVMGYPDQNGSLKSVKTEGIRFVPWILDRVNHQIVGLGSENSVYPVTRLPRYQWPGWNEVKYQERKKQSYDIMKKALTESPASQ
jgi:hypothetical protein